MGTNNMKKSITELHKACDDMVCAVRENPHAFDHIKVSQGANTNLKQEADIGIFRELSLFSMTMSILIRMFN